MPGDAGAPLVRAGAGGRAEVVALATGAHQVGCLGSDDTSGSATAADAVSLAALPAATADLFDQLTLSPVDSGQNPVAGADFAAAVAVGDFNKDGYADLALGTPGEAIRTVKAGPAAVFYGSSAGLNTAVGIDEGDIGQADVAGDGFGQSLAAGDFNGDGCADLAIGVPSKVIGGARSGQVEILKGSSAGLSKTSPYIVSQTAVSGAANEAGDRFGYALAAGNVVGAKTGTVYADLVVGAPGETPATDPKSGAGVLYTPAGRRGHHHPDDLAHPGRDDPAGRRLRHRRGGRPVRGCARGR